ncbi:MAG TPA: hypothetical protein VM287_11620 [Egibacteraceae bacterium]|jgi:adenosylmethionine-8-amino-7-oxononanoate aminotransferase|nr:hypothetical protein [Egibacteraceae bacterium]
MSSDVGTRPMEEYPLWHGAITLKDERRFCAPEDRLVEGKGVRVRASSGRWFLDARSSLRTAILGYDYGSVVDAVVDQVHKLPYAEIVRYSRPSDVAVRYSPSSRKLVKVPPAP